MIVILSSKKKIIFNREGEENRTNLYHVYCVNNAGGSVRSLHVLCMMNLCWISIIFVCNEGDDDDDDELLHWVQPS